MFPSVNYTFKNKPLNGQRLPYEREQPLREKALLPATHFILIIKAPHTSLSMSLSVHAHLFTFSQCHAHMCRVCLLCSIFHLTLFSSSSMHMGSTYITNYPCDLPSSTFRPLVGRRPSFGPLMSQAPDTQRHTTTVCCSPLRWLASQNMQRQASTPTTKSPPLGTWALVGAKHHIHTNEQPDRII